MECRLLKLAEILLERFPVLLSLFCSFLNRNLLLDEGGHLKIGEYWIQMLYEQVDPFQDLCMSSYQLTACNSFMNSQLL